MAAWCTLLLVLTLTPGIAGAAQEPSVTPASGGGTLRVLATDFPPFYYIDEAGEPAGLEHEIMRSFAASEGRTLEVIWVEEFGDIFDALLRGDGDVIASTVTITQERRQRVDFSTPYFPVRVLLVEPRDSATYGREALAGKRVATIEGTTYEQALAGIADVRPVYVSSERQMYEAVAAGRADALATDSTNYLWIGRDFPDLRVTAALTDKAFYGFAVRPGDPLLAALDAHLEKLEQDGTYWGYLDQFFGELIGEYMGELQEEFLEPEPTRGEE